MPPTWTIGLAHELARAATTWLGRCPAIPLCPAPAAFSCPDLHCSCPASPPCPGAPAPVLAPGPAGAGLSAAAAALLVLAGIAIGVLLARCCAVHSRRVGGWDRPEPREDSADTLEFKIRDGLGQRRLPARALR